MEGSILAAEETMQHEVITQNSYNCRRTRIILPCVWVLASSFHSINNRKCSQCLENKVEKVKESESVDPMVQIMI